MNKYKDIYEYTYNINLHNYIISYQSLCLIKNQDLVV